jgi:hypothetical protein
MLATLLTSLLASLILALLPLPPAPRQSDKSDKKPTFATIENVIPHPSLDPAPIEITSVSVGETPVTVLAGPITVGRPFDAADNWIESIQVQVKNTSAQTLIGLSAHVVFKADEPDGFPVLPEIPIEIGRQYWLHPSGLQPFGELDTGFALAPGDTVTLHLTPVVTKLLQNTVASKNPARSVLHDVIIKPDYAASEANYIWYRGFYMQRDPANPMRLYNPKVRRSASTRSFRGSDLAAYERGDHSVFGNSFVPVNTAPLNFTFTDSMP